MLINGPIYLHFQEMSPSHYRCNYSILLAVPWPLLNTDTGRTWTHNFSTHERLLYRSGHRTTVWRERQESLSTAIQLYISTAMSHMDGLPCVHIITLSYSCIAVLKFSHLPRHITAPWPNRLGTLKFAALNPTRTMLYTDHGTASSILKLCLHFMIISPYTVFTKTEKMISIDSIFMRNVVFTNYGIHSNTFSSHCSIEKHYTCSIYCVVLTEYFFLNTFYIVLSQSCILLNRLYIVLSHSCILHNGIQHFGAGLNQVRCIIHFYAFWPSYDLA